MGEILFQISVLASGNLTLPMAYRWSSSPCVFTLFCLYTCLPLNQNFLSFIVLLSYWMETHCNDLVFYLITSIITPISKIVHVMESRVSGLQHLLNWIQFNTQYNQGKSKDSLLGTIFLRITGLTHWLH